MHDARILVSGKSQAKKAITAVRKKPTGMAALAEMRKPTNMIATTNIGSRARKESRVRDMGLVFGNRYSVVGIRCSLVSLCGVGPARRGFNVEPWTIF